MWSLGHLTTPAPEISKAQVMRPLLPLTTSPFLLRSTAWLAVSSRALLGRVVSCEASSSSISLGEWCRSVKARVFRLSCSSILSHSFPMHSHRLLLFAYRALGFPRGLLSLVRSLYSRNSVLLARVGGAEMLLDVFCSCDPGLRLKGVAFRSSNRVLSPPPRKRHC